MNAEIDILENVILDEYPQVLEILLRDHTTSKNIFWATTNYEDLGSEYKFSSCILPELITGEYGNLIMPRVKKDKVLQQTRLRDMAEVFTPSWICNAQNNLIDNVWFGSENVFNKEIYNDNGTRNWVVNDNKITFPKGKTWKHYVRDTRLEMACGEAPYIVSRYDTTTGEFIPVENRIGILDRKLRVINENVENSGEWLLAVQDAYKNTYAFEWQGDSLLLAREAMLFTFIENHRLKFGKEPLLKSIKFIAYIISWNVWQMDGLKGVIPKTCGGITITNVDLFGNVKTENSFCKGCLDNNILKHNGTKCLIKDWANKGKKIEFISLLKNS